MQTNTSPIPIEHYWGLESLAKRLGCSKRTVQRMIDRSFIPIYPRYHPQKKVSRILYSNSHLLALYEWKQAQEYLEYRRARPPQRSKGPPDPTLRKGPPEPGER